MNNQDQNTNIRNKTRKQDAVNEVLVLNSIPSSQVEYETTVPSENNSHYEIPLAYNINKPMEPKAWNGEAHPHPLFGTMKFLEIDAKNIYTSLLHICNDLKLELRLQLRQRLEEVKGINRSGKA